MIGLQIWIQESSNFWLKCSLARIMVVVKDLLASPNFKSIIIIKAKCFLGSSTTLRRPGRPREPHLGEWPHLFEFGLSRASQSTWYSHSRSLVLSSIILFFIFLLIIQTWPGKWSIVALKWHQERKWKRCFWKTFILSLVATLGIFDNLTLGFSQPWWWFRKKS